MWFMWLLFTCFLSSSHITIIPCLLWLDINCGSPSFFIAFFSPTPWLYFLIYGAAKVCKPCMKNDHPELWRAKKKKTRGHRQNYLDKAPNLPLIASLSSLYFYFSIVSGNSNSKISILTWARTSVFRNLHNLSALKPARVTIGEISYGPTSWTDTGTPTLLYSFLFSFFFCFLFSFCF